MRWYQSMSCSTSRILADWIGGNSTWSHPSDSWGACTRGHIYTIEGSLGSTTHITQKKHLQDAHHHHDRGTEDVGELLRPSPAMKHHDKPSTAWRSVGTNVLLLV